MKTELQKQNDNVATAVCLLAGKCVFYFFFCSDHQRTGGIFSA